MLMFVYAVFCMLISNITLEELTQWKKTGQYWKDLDNNGGSGLTVRSLDNIGGGALIGEASAILEAVA
nr:unnamed protein product [Callosobruchus chinensis]